MKQWILHTKRADFNYLAKRFSISPVMARIIVNRGLKTETEIDQYLNGKLSDLSPSYLMKDMEKGVEIVKDCIKNKKLICISSDFDVDGVCGGYILWCGIKKAGGEAYIDAPDRISEGYGLNRRIVNDAIEKGAVCILTCDNGIAAMDAVNYAKEKGLQVVVTDHHEVAYHYETQDAGQVCVYDYPNADAVIDPKQELCSYPFDGLCGAGVAYKFVELLYEYSDINPHEAEVLLPFAAMATVADVMDLVGENRIIVKEGLKQIQYTSHVGLRALLRETELEGKKISAYMIGFVIGPCLNAAGRLDRALKAVRLLQSASEAEAEQLAKELVALNNSRKEMTIEGYETAVEIIERNGLQKRQVILLCLENCHESLVGIIAGRVKERYNRPAIIGTRIGDDIKASGRSVEQYNMFEKLSECRWMFKRFGGHAMAAGLTISADCFEQLGDFLNEHSGLTEAMLTPKVYIDVPVPLEYLSEYFINELEKLEPFGKGNRKPEFAEQHFSILEGIKVGKNKNVLKLKIQNKTGAIRDAVYFGDLNDFESYVSEEFGETELRRMYEGKKNAIDLGFTYYPTINEYKDYRNLQIVIQNFQRIHR